MTCRLKITQYTQSRTIMADPRLLNDYRFRLSRASQLRVDEVHPWSNWMLSLVVACTAAWIGASLVLVPGEEPSHFHFLDERGAITVLSALFLAASSAFALVAFLVSHHRPMDADSWFWLVAAGGLAMLSLDELLQFHERLGGFLDADPALKTSAFRNWNDIIVIGYGFLAVGIGLYFLPVVLSYNRMIQLLGIAFFMFAIHTVVDSIAEPPTHTSVVIEESAKLFTGAFILLAMLQGMLQSVRLSGYSKAAIPASISEATQRTNSG